MLFNVIMAHNTELHISIANPNPSINYMLHTTTDWMLKPYAQVECGWKMMPIPLLCPTASMKATKSAMFTRSKYIRNANNWVR